MSAGPICFGPGGDGWGNSHSNCPLLGCGQQRPLDSVSPSMRRSGLLPSRLRDSWYPLKDWCRPQPWHCLFTPWFGVPEERRSTGAEPSLLLWVAGCFLGSFLWWPCSLNCEGLNTPPRPERLASVITFQLNLWKDFPNDKAGWTIHKAREFLAWPDRRLVWWREWACLFHASKMLYWRGLKLNWHSLEGSHYEAQTLMENLIEGCCFHPKSWAWVLRERAVWFLEGSVLLDLYLELGSWIPSEEKPGEHNFGSSPNQKAKLSELSCADIWKGESPSKKVDI